jgi:TolB-like protein
VKKIIFGLTLVFLCGVCFAQQVVVAVFPFEARSGTSPDDANTVTEVFNIKLQATGALRTVGRNVIDNVIKQEHVYQMSDFASDEKTAQIKKGLNADWVVYGVVTKLGKTFVITATLIDLNTNETMGGTPMQMNSIEEAFEKMDAPITEMIQRLTSGSGARAASQRPTSGREGLENTINRATNFFHPFINRLPQNKKVAVLNVNSQDPDAAEYVIGELAWYLLEAGFTVLDMRSGDNMLRELGFQISGEVSDESAFRIGKFVGADIVITGAISGSGTSRILRLRALDIITGRIIAVSRQSL